MHLKPSKERSDPQIADKLWSERSYIVCTKLLEVVENSEKRYAWEKRGKSVGAVRLWR